MQSFMGVRSLPGNAFLLERFYVCRGVGLRRRLAPTSQALCFLGALALRPILDAIRCGGQGMVLESGLGSRATRCRVPVTRCAQA